MSQRATPKKRTLKRGVSLRREGRLRAMPARSEGGRGVGRARALPAPGDSMSMFGGSCGAPGATGPGSLEWNPSIEQTPLARRTHELFVGGEEEPRPVR